MVSLLQLGVSGNTAAQLIYATSVGCVLASYELLWALLLPPSAQVSRAMLSKEVTCSNIHLKKQSQEDLCL